MDAAHRKRRDDNGLHMHQREIERMHAISLNRVARLAA
jgi:hypothetical protein